MAPELLDEHSDGVRPTIASDIYGVSLVCWSVSSKAALLWPLTNNYAKAFSGEQPFASARTERNISRVILEGLRPARPAPGPFDFPDLVVMPDSVWLVITEAWSENPDNRPGLDRLKEVLSPKPSPSLLLDPPSHHLLYPWDRINFPGLSISFAAHSQSQC